MPLLFRRGPSVAPRTEPLLPDGPGAGSARRGHLATAGGGDGTPAVAAHGAAAVLAVWPLFVVLVAKFALNLAFAGRYGWQRDELYYAVAGRHLQGGYVEFPPVTALLSAAARVLFGWSLIGFRSFAVLAGAATIVLAALVARELGGGRGAQVIAAAAVAFSPRLVSANGLFQPVSFDLAATMLVLWLALRLALGRGSWPALGVAVGVGLETKYTLSVVLVLLVAGFVAWRRDVLATRGFLFAVLVAGALMAPNLLWEAGHGWISVHWFLHPPASATNETRLQYINNLLQQLNYAVVVVAVLGAVMLLRDRRLRPLGLTVVGVPVAYFLLGGKSYYAGPVVLFALAAGAVPLARWATRRLRLAAVGVLGALRLLSRLRAPWPDRDAHSQPRARPAHRRLHTRLEPRRRVAAYPASDALMMAPATPRRRPDRPVQLPPPDARDGGPLGDRLEEICVPGRAAGVVTGGRRANHLLRSSTRPSEDHEGDLRRGGQEGAAAARPSGRH